MNSVASYLNVSELTANPLIVVGFLLLAGHGISVLTRRIRLPEITGYILAGLIFGLLRVVNHENAEGLSVISEVALALIALTIGGEFSWRKMRRYGNKMLLITAIQVFGAFAVVSVALAIFQLSIPLAMMMGAISAATAPAATVAIVQSLRIKGEFVDYLYGVVALDDAATVMLFGIISALAGLIIGMAGGASLFHEIFRAGGEIFFSLLLGVASAILLHFISYRQRNEAVLSIMVLGIVLLNAGLSLHFHLSALLTNMAAGTALINLSSRNERLFRTLQPFAPSIYALFFVLAGAELDPTIIFQQEVLFIGALYIIARAIGKYGGVFVGCAIVGASRPIRNWLGICMLPQAGVALGLVLVLQRSPLAQVSELVPFISTMINVVLLSVFVNEIVGPVLSKIAIVRGSVKR